MSSAMGNLQGRTNMSVLQIDKLSKVFRRGFWGRPVIALHELTLNVEAGEIYGFLGPNGAGKTTTVKILLRIIYPTSGSATIMGKPLGHPDVVNQVGYMPENPYFYRFLTGREFLRFFARLANISAAEAAKRADQLLEQVGMSHAADVRIAEYSKGMVTRIGLAQALLREPAVLFLDEPMSGLDPIGRREIRQIIMNLRARGKTIFFCSHILSDVEAICDRVAILNKGRVVAQGNLDDILGNEGGFEITFRKDENKKQPPDFNGIAEKITDAGPSYAVVVPSQELVAQAIDLAGSANDTLLSVVQRRESLENYFIRKLGRPS